MQSSNASEYGQVIPFRARAPRRHRRTLPLIDGPRRSHPVCQDECDERPVLNLVGLVFCIALALAGVWIVDQVAELQRLQDCVLSGRSSCLPLARPDAVGAL